MNSFVDVGVYVLFDGNDATILVEWFRFDLKVDDQLLGRRTQIPLELSWAITIHKAQGLEFDSIIIDLACCWEAGQAYTALSRCRKASGLYLLRFNTRCLLASARAITFDNTVS